MTIIPDWTKPKEIVLVYPEGLICSHKREDRRLLIPFIHNLLSLLNENEPGLYVTLIKGDLVLNDTGIKWVENLRDMYPNLLIAVKSIKVKDIWIRDWAPIPVEENGNYKLLRAIYEPNYCHPSGDFEVLENRASQYLQLYYTNSLKKIPLKWEIGNLTTNGETMIVTDHLHINNKMTLMELTRKLRETFDNMNVRVIPVEPRDTVGHSDAIIRFVDEKTVVVPVYPHGYDEENKYITWTVERLQNLNLKVIYIPSILSEEINLENIASAEGCYVNYFRIGDHIYLPQYNIEEDETAIYTFNKHFPNLKIIPVNYCNTLSSLGGVLNCMTWSFY